MKTRLSPNYSLVEFTRNSRGLPNIPPREVVERYRWLCVFLLEPIREKFGKPIRITSGYRKPELNKLVGGEETSYHLADEDRAACDFQVQGATLQEVFDWIRLESGLLFDLVILERGRQEKHEYDDCIHIQIRSNPRRIAKAGETHGTGSYTEVEVK